LTSSLAVSPVDVPFLPQTDGLCGGAAVAMVFRYWGDAHADMQQFAPLVDRRAGGIADGVLVDAVRARGWIVRRSEGSVGSLNDHLQAKQPVIVLIGDRRDRYHYVVVTGLQPDAVVVHDPSWGPSRAIRTEEFLRLWGVAQFWSLVILPPASKTDVALGSGPTEATTQLRETSRPEPATDAASTHNDPCDVLLRSAIADVQHRGLADADAILGRARSECPTSPGPLRELAGVRFAQRRWPEAAALARDALALDAHDAYALDVLGSSLFMQNDSSGALRAWNQVGKPRVNMVHIEGIRHSRYQTIAEALRIQPNMLLTAASFELARRRLDELPDRSTARIGLRPEADGYATVDIGVAERAAVPHGPLEWTAAAARAGIDRKVEVSAPGFSGQGEVWSASWRWWANRPAVSVAFAAPRIAGLPGVWRVDGSWQVETYAIDGTSSEAVREERRHGGLTVSDWTSGSLRWTLGAGFDAWSGNRKTASISAGIDRRWFADRLAVSLDASNWMAVTSHPGFHTIAARTRWQSSTAARSWVYRGSAGLERVSNAAPLALWPGAGDGHARAPLLRAHQLLDDGIVGTGGDAAFGRTLAFGNVEVQRWFERPALVKVGVAFFTDTARAFRRASSAAGLVQVDSGGGLRLKLPNTTGVLRIDVAHGIRDGSNALTFGWMLQ